MKQMQHAMYVDLITDLRSSLSAALWLMPRLSFSLPNDMGLMPGLGSGAASDGACPSGLRVALKVVP